MDGNDFDVANASVSLLPRSAEAQVLKEFVGKTKTEIGRLVDILKRNGYDPVTGKPPLGPWPPNIILKDIISIVDRHRHGLTHGSSRAGCGTCAFLAEFDDVRKNLGIIPTCGQNQVPVESLCKTCQSGPFRSLKCLFENSELVGDDMIECVGYVPETAAPTKEVEKP